MESINGKVGVKTPGKTDACGAVSPVNETTDDQGWIGFEAIFHYGVGERLTIRGVLAVRERFRCGEASSCDSIDSSPARGKPKATPSVSSVSPCAQPFSSLCAAHISLSKLVAR